MTNQLNKDTEYIQRFPHEIRTSKVFITEEKEVGIETSTFEVVARKINWIRKNSNFYKEVLKGGL